MMHRYLVHDSGNWALETSDGSASDPMVSASCTKRSVWGTATGSNQGLDSPYLRSKPCWAIEAVFIQSFVRLGAGGNSSGTVKHNEKVCMQCKQ